MGGSKTLDFLDGLSEEALRELQRQTEDRIKAKKPIGFTHQQNDVEDDIEALPRPPRSGRDNPAGRSQEQLLQGRVRLGPPFIPSAPPSNSANSGSMSKTAVPRYSNMQPIGTTKKKNQSQNKTNQHPGVIGTNSNYIFYIRASVLLESQLSVFSHWSEALVDEETRFLVKEGLMKQIHWKTWWGQDEMTIAIREAFEDQGPEFDFVFARNGNSKAGSAFRLWPDVVHIRQVRDFQHLKTFFNGCKYVFIFDAHYTTLNSQPADRQKFEAEWLKKWVAKKQEIAKNVFKQAQKTDPPADGDPETGAEGSDPNRAVCEGCHNLYSVNGISRHHKKCWKYKELKSQFSVSDGEEIEEVKLEVGFKDPVFGKGKNRAYPVAQVALEDSDDDIRFIKASNSKRPREESYGSSGSSANTGLPAGQKRRIKPENQDNSTAEAKVFEDLKKNLYGVRQALQGLGVDVYDLLDRENKVPALLDEEDRKPDLDPYDNVPAMDPDEIHMAAQIEEDHERLLVPQDPKEGEDSELSDLDDDEGEAKAIKTKVQSMAGKKKVVSKTKAVKRIPDVSKGQTRKTRSTAKKDATKSKD